MGDLMKFFALNKLNINSKQVEQKVITIQEKVIKVCGQSFMTLLGCLYIVVCVSYKILIKFLTVFL